MPTISAAEELRDFESYHEKVIIKLHFENARLQPIVDKLPKTADGVPITIESNVWVHGRNGPKQCMVTSIGWTDVVLLFHGIDDGQHSPADCYSTLEAAESAKGAV